MAAYELQGRDTEMRAWEGVSWKRLWCFSGFLATSWRELGERMRMRRDGRGGRRETGAARRRRVMGLELEGRHGRIVAKVRFAVVSLCFCLVFFFSPLLSVGTDHQE
jgi:hypothetical protein